MAECGKPVGRGVVNFPCIIDKDHDGPCVAAEKPESARARQRWLDEQRLSKIAGAPVVVEEPVDASFDEVVEGVALATGGEVVVDEPTKQREGDQPLPVVNDSPFVQDALKEFIENRKKVGISRYGTALQPNNGRDSLVDALEEAVDLATYLAQIVIERDGCLPG